MPTNLDRYKKDLEHLIGLGDMMSLDLLGKSLKKSGVLNTPEHKKIAEDVKRMFANEYQNWFTEASAVIRQIIPDRLNEFQELYKGNGKRKDISGQTYNIQDWLNGVRSGENRMFEKVFNDENIVCSRFDVQLKILKSVQTRFESSLYDIRQLVQADLLDSEIDAARELLKAGFVRAAGAVAGVVLEKHLGQVASNHSLSAKKANPTISNFNDLLRDNNVLDTPSWRNVQRLGDLRNLCDHSKHRDPTKEEIEELINGVEKLTKTLF